MTIFLYEIHWHSESWEYGLMKADSLEKAEEIMAEKAGDARSYYLEAVDEIEFRKGFYVILER